MDTFQFSRPTTVDQAVQLGATSSTAQQSAEVRFVAGGTTLIDLMKLNVERPRQIVDINVLPLDKIETAPNGGLIIGALARNSDVAHNPTVQRVYPVLSQALLSGASPQLRNMATLAASTSATPRTPATSETPAPAAPQSTAITARSLSSVPARIASQQIRPTRTLHLPRLRRRFRFRGQRVSAAFQFTNFIYCPARLPIAKPSWSRAT